MVERLGRRTLGDGAGFRRFPAASEQLAPFEAQGQRQARTGWLSIPARRQDHRGKVDLRRFPVPGGSCHGRSQWGFQRTRSCVGRDTRSARRPSNVSLLLHLILPECGCLGRVHEADGAGRLRRPSSEGSCPRDDDIPQTGDLIARSMSDPDEISEQHQPPMFECTVPGELAYLTPSLVFTRKLTPLAPTHKCSTPRPRTDTPRTSDRSRGQLRWAPSVHHSR